MELFSPEKGLIIWMALIFIIVFIILGKFAFPFITKAIAKREEHIADSIRKADEINAQLESIKEERKSILAEAREEQNKALKEVTKLKEKLIQDAKDQAKAEAAKIMEETKASILQEKEKALKGIKNQVALISIDIAGKVLKKSLEKDKAQQDYVNTLLDDIKVLNN